MTILAALLAVLTNFVSLEAERAEFHFECHQIGDNEYTCDGGRL